MFAISGCAQMEPPKFRQDGISQKQHDADSYRCEVEARNTPGGMCRQMEIFVKCMNAKGYGVIPGTGNKGECGDIF
jgi:hypothetical protein